MKHTTSDTIKGSVWRLPRPTEIGRPSLSQQGVVLAAPPRREGGRGARGLAEHRQRKNKTGEPNSQGGNDGDATGSEREGGRPPDPGDGCVAERRRRSRGAALRARPPTAAALPWGACKRQRQLRPPLLASEDEPAADAMLVAEPTVSIAVADGPRKVTGRRMMYGTGRGAADPRNAAARWCCRRQYCEIGLQNIFRFVGRSPSPFCPGRVRRRRPVRLWGRRRVRGSRDSLGRPDSVPPGPKRRRGRRGRRRGRV
jgi:hypothetical protein